MTYMGGAFMTYMGGILMAQMDGAVTVWGGDMLKNTGLQGNVTGM